MGLCQSQEDKELSQKSKAIDKEMMQGHIAQQKVVKLLLLGAGECGKSTVLKQMRILHDHGFSQEEADQQKAVVYNNTVQAMASILRAMTQLGIQFEDKTREADARVVLECVKEGKESEPFSDALTKALKNLWNDKGVSVEAVSRGREFQLTESGPQDEHEMSRNSPCRHRLNEPDRFYSTPLTDKI